MWCLRLQTRVQAAAIATCGAWLRKTHTAPHKFPLRMRDAEHDGLDELPAVDDHELRNVRSAFFFVLFSIVAGLLISFCGDFGSVEPVDVRECAMVG